MSLTDRLNDMSDLPEVPRAAFSNFEQREISDDWLSTAEPEEQVAAMVEWFQARFEDPANETPYMSSEGGYIWVHGGPYDASDEIQERFGHIVPFEVMVAAPATAPPARTCGGRAARLPCRSAGLRPVSV